MLRRCIDPKTFLPSYGGMTRQHHYECGLDSIGYRVEQVFARSHRPSNYWCIDQEHLAMGRTLLLLRHERKLPPRVFRELRVDSILQAGTKKHREIATKVSNLTRKDLGFQGDDVVCRAETVDKESRTLLDFTPPLPTTCGEKPELVPWWKD